VTDKWRRVENVHIGIGRWLALIGLGVVISIALVVGYVWLTSATFSDENGPALLAIAFLFAVAVIIFGLRWWFSARVVSSIGQWNDANAKAGKSRDMPMLVAQVFGLGLILSAGLKFMDSGDGDADGNWLFTLVALAPLGVVVLSIALYWMRPADVRKSDPKPKSQTKYLIGGTIVTVLFVFGAVEYHHYSHGQTSVFNRFSVSSGSTETPVLR